MAAQCVDERCCSTFSGLSVVCLSVLSFNKFTSCESVINHSTTNYLLGQLIFLLLLLFYSVNAIHFLSLFMYIVCVLTVILMATVVFIPLPVVMMLFQLMTWASTQTWMSACVPKLHKRITFLQCFEAITQHLSFIVSLGASVVLMRLDYCNATLVGSPSFQLCHLLAVMNAVTRLVLCS